MLFLALTILLCLLFLAGLVYLISRFHRFRIIQEIQEKNKRLSWFLAAVPLLLIIVVFLFSPYVAVIGTLHLLAFWGVGDLIAFLIRKGTKKTFRYDFLGIGVVLFTCIYLGFGWHFAHHVYETDYVVDTDKHLSSDSVRVVLIADSHLGEILSGDDFAREMERIEAVHPDLLIIAGDFVDDDSDRANMEKACRALGTLETTYGIYLTFGNHDEGYFEGSRDFTLQDLRDELEKNHVTVLEDETVLINDELYLIGRKDRSEENRMPIEALTVPLDQSKYMLVIDHQPNDYQNEADANVDLVVSGHTHGGHIFPAGYIGVWIGANDAFYGLEQRGNTDFIITSGISGWAIPLKTGAISEYVVIDIQSEG